MTVLNLNDDKKILSIRRTIEQKKKERGLSSSLLNIKGLSKYRSVEDLSYPDSLYKKRTYIQTCDKGGQFREVKYHHLFTLLKHQHSFNKVVGIVSKSLMNEFNALGLNTKETTEEQVQNYLQELGLIEYKVKKELMGSSDLKTYQNTSIRGKDLEEKQFIYAVFESSKPKEAFDCFWEVSCPSLKEPAYTLFNQKVKKEGGYSGRNRFTSHKARFVDFFTHVAKELLLRTVGDYLSLSEKNHQHVEENLTLLLTHSEEDLNFFRQLNTTRLMEMFIRCQGRIPDYYASVVLITLEVMLQEVKVLNDHEERIKKISNGYATSYVTKKNIPQKIQTYMESNEFLNMFGYVEVDEECDLDLLRKIETQFKELSKTLPLIRVKDHSLRFRRLGKLKASGVYFPGVNTLAVDINNVSSFVHEYFHLLDFTQGLLSVEDNFKPILKRYRELVEENLRLLPSDHPVVIHLNKENSKYSKEYFLSVEEVFARTGEIYVAKCLKLDSSFNSTTFTRSCDFQTKPYEITLDHVVYPQNNTFLTMIKDYFDQLFIELFKTSETVKFDKVKQEKKVVDETGMNSEDKKEEMNSSSSRSVVSSSMPSSVITSNYTPLSPLKTSKIMKDGSRQLSLF